MKKIVGVIAILAILLGVLVGCNANKPQHSSCKLDITANLNSYSEEQDRAQMETKKDVLFAQNGISDYYILLDINVGEEVVQSSKEMSAILNKMLGSTNQFAVSTSIVNGGKYISIGDTPQALTQNFDKSDITYDGFAIKTDSQNNFYILAREENGLSNGIYTMLEDIFGCMFVRDDFDYIPRFSTIYLDKLDVVNNPDFEWRKIFQYEVAQNKWYKKLKNNGVCSENIEKNAEWGTWCHSVFAFVDPNIYATEHPEYFVFVDGEPRQLCLTNPDIYPIVEAKMAELMAADPEIKYWDFSLNDNQDYCKCENCAKVLEETGSMMGTMLPILNKLAKKFPDKMISTLAYFYNKEVPKGAELEDNVNIVVAPIATGQLYTYKNGDTAKAKQAHDLISSWGKVAKSVFVWDYVVNFHNLLLPYPNFDVQKDNHEFYLNNNVKAIFHQGSREHNDELACLRSYVLSRQVWDNSVDINKIIAKYLKVTYGKAAPYVAQYLDKMNDELRKKAKDLDLYDNANRHACDYLSESNVNRYCELIDNAINAEKDDEIIANRLEEIKINVLYAKMTCFSLNISQKKQAFEEFQVLVKKHDIKRCRETDNIVDFINVEYPKYLTNVKLIISAIVIVPILIAAVAATVIVLVKRKKNKNKV